MEHIGVLWLQMIQDERVGVAWSNTDKTQTLEVDLFCDLSSMLNNFIKRYIVPPFKPDGIVIMLTFVLLNTQKPRQIRRRFAEIFKYIFLNKSVLISIKISLKICS